MRLLSAVCFAFHRAAKSLGVLVLVMSFSVACGSAEAVRVNVDADTNRTTYETTTMRMSDVRGFSGLTQPRFEVFVTGTCDGQKCTPEIFDLVFRTDPGAGSVRLQASDVELVFGDDRLYWDDPFRELEGQMFETRGTIVAVECSMDELKSLASGGTVKGSLGGISFTVYEKNLGPVRSLIQQVESPAPAS